MHGVVVPGRTRPPSTGDSAAGAAAPARTRGRRHAPRSRPVHRLSRLGGIGSAHRDMGRCTPGKSESMCRAGALSRCRPCGQRYEFRLELRGGAAEYRVPGYNHIVVSASQLWSHASEGFTHDTAGTVAANSISQFLRSGHPEAAVFTAVRHREENTVRSNSFFSRRIRVLERRAFPHPEAGWMPLRFYHDRVSGSGRS
jgi:hypothetical protein